MKTVVRKIREYLCENCNPPTHYGNKKDALRCESLPKEKKKRFYIGDTVQAKIHRHCIRPPHEYITCRGVVVGIGGPELNELQHKHMFFYLIQYRCPHCKDISEAKYYTSEIKLVSRKKRK